MAKKFPLEIVIGATDKASAAIKKITDRVDRINEPFSRLSKNLGKLSDATGLSKVGTALAGVGTAAITTAKRIAVGFTAATAAVSLFTYRTAMAADTIGDTAERLNISTDALQAWTYGFEQADVAPEQLASSLDTLNKNLGLAKIGMGKSVKIFQGLGLDPKKFKTVDQLLPALADKLAKISDPAKRAAIANRLLGDAGAQMAVKLAEGSKALADMDADARAVEAIVGPEVIANAGRFDKLMKSLTATLKGAAGNAVGELYPALLDLGKGLQQAIIDNLPEIKEFAKNFGKNLPQNISDARKSIDDLGKALKPFVDVLGYLSEKFGLLNVAIAAFSVIVGGQLIVALTSLGFALAGVGVSLTAAFLVPGLIVAAIGLLIYAGWKLYKNWDLITAGLKIAWDMFADSYTKKWESMKETAANAMHWIAEKIRAILGDGWLSKKFDGLGRSINAPANPGAAAIGGNLLLRDNARQRVDVKVDLSNLPPGTRADATASDGVGFDLSRGYAMPGIN